MIYLFVRLIPALTTIFVLLVGAIRAQPCDAGELHLLLGDGDCWQGICVDVTHRADVLRTLEANPWVGEIFQTEFYISWRWSGRQPSVIDASQDGLLPIGGDVVRQLRLGTLLRFGDIWMALDRPDDALLMRPVSRYSVYQIALCQRPPAKAGGLS